MLVIKVLVLAALSVLAFAFLVSLVTSLPIWLLWNWVGVGVFGGPHLTFWEVWGTLLLLSILVGVVKSKVTTK